MNKTIKQVVVNVFSLWLSVVVQGVLAFLLIPFLIGVMGKDGYGVVGLLGVMVGMSAIADMGLRGALGRELAEQVVRRDIARFNELITTALALYVCVACVLALACWLMAPWLTSFFHVPAQLQGRMVLLTRLYCGVSLFFSFATPVFNAALGSYQRFDLINGMETFRNILSSCCLFLMLPAMSDTIYGWAGIMLLSQLMLLALVVYWTWRVCPGVSIRARHFCPARLPALFRLGGYMYALQLTRMLSIQSDPLIISRFFGPGGVALYKPGQQISGTLQGIVNAFANQLYPLTTKQHVDQQTLKMQRLLVSGTKYTLLLGVAAVVAMFVGAEPLCRLWMFSSLGADYKVVAAVLMGWAASDFMAYSSGTQWPVLLGMKKLKVLVWTQLPTAVLNVLVSIYLVGFTKLGIPGVLVATVIIGFVRRPIIIAYTAKLCGLSAWSYLREGYCRPFVVLFLLGGMAFGLRQSMVVDSWLALFVFFGCILVIWMALAWSVGLDGEERGLFLKEVRSMLSNKRRNVHG